MIFTPEAVAFYLLGALALGGGIAVIFSRHPIHSALALVSVFLVVACLYALLLAHLLAALQVIVYAGAIMVLFLFVIMLLNADAPSLDLLRTPPWARWTGVAVAAGLTTVFVWAFKNTELPVAGAGGHTLEKIAEAGETSALSELLFTQYLLPFELTSALLLAGLLGAVSLAKRRPHAGGGR